MTVFLFLGLGLALPFLLIGFVPALARRLPKPGPWMETLKHVLAFPMYATALWLLWVLGKQRGVDGMALVLGGLLLFAFGLWLFERNRWTGSRAVTLLGVLLAIGALVPAWGVTQLAPPARAAQAASENVVEYSPQLLDRLRADNRVVFVNMTADWCVSCKANERAVLSRPEFRNCSCAPTRCTCAVTTPTSTRRSPRSLKSTRPWACRCTWCTARGAADRAADPVDPGGGRGSAAAHRTMKWQRPALLWTAVRRPRPVGRASILTRPVCTGRANDGFHSDGREACPAGG